MQDLIEELCRLASLMDAADRDEIHYDTVALSAVEAWTMTKLCDDAEVDAEAIDQLTMWLYDNFVLAYFAGVETFYQF